MRKLKRIFLIVLVGIVVVIISGFAYLKTQTYAPTMNAQQVSDQAKSRNDWLYFPSKDKTKPMIIFYPGALVEPESYSLWAQTVAKAGYPVYILKMPLDLAVLAPNRGEKVLSDQSDRDYVLGGHSLGGVMASRFAKDHPGKLVGMFFLASYPDEKGSLADTKIPVLSLTGENDKVLNREAYQKAKKDLPKSTGCQEIAGGNHAGFGAYGAQKGDGKSTIDNQNQQVSERLLAWLTEKVE